MKIAFDHQIFLQQAYGGVSRYFASMASEFIKMKEDIRVIAPIHCNRYLDDIPSKNIIGRKIPKIRGTSRLDGLNRYLSQKAVNKFSPSIFHESYYSQHSVCANGAARILTVYDMIHQRLTNFYPNQDKYNQIKRAAIRRADHVIAISHSTKHDLCEIYDVNPDDVSVVHLGVEKFSLNTQSKQNNFIDRPYLLYVGSRNGYKNFENMLRAVASSKNLRETFDIVAFGNQAFTRSELEFASSLGLQPNSLHHINGSDNVLGLLYSGASAFVYPSLYEGFGLPPLEAMSQGCPVVLSNTSSMPEVVGDAGEYFSPYNVEEQVQAICNVVFDNTRRANLIELGKNQLKQFSWRNCALETLEVYKSVL